MYIVMIQGEIRDYAIAITTTDNYISLSLYIRFTRSESASCFIKSLHSSRLVCERISIQLVFNYVCVSSFEDLNKVLRQQPEVLDDQLKLSLPLIICFR